MKIYKGQCTFVTDIEALALAEIELQLNEASMIYPLSIKCVASEDTKDGFECDARFTIEFVIISSLECIESVHNVLYEALDEYSENDLECIQDYDVEKKLQDLISISASYGLNEETSFYGYQEGYPEMIQEFQSMILILNKLSLKEI